MTFYSTMCYNLGFYLRNGLLFGLWDFYDLYNTYKDNYLVAGGYTKVFCPFYNLQPSEDFLPLPYTVSRKLVHGSKWKTYSKEASINMT